MGCARSKFFVIISLSALLFAGFGIGMMDMDMNKDGAMDGCLFTGNAMLCSMNLVEHIALWQSMFTVAPTKITILALFFLFAVFTTTFLTWCNSLFRSWLPEYSLLKQRQRFKPHDIFFDPIRYALARGILQPQIYNSASMN